jgi:hypothetical protein
MEAFFGDGGDFFFELMEIFSEFFGLDGIFSEFFGIDGNFFGVLRTRWKFFRDFLKFSLIC